MVGTIIETSFYEFVRIEFLLCKDINIYFCRECFRYLKPENKIRAAMEILQGVFDARKDKKSHCVVAWRTANE